MKRENISEMLLSNCFPINIRPAGPPKMKSRYGIHYWKVQQAQGGGVGGQRFFYSLKQIYLVFNHLTPYAQNPKISLRTVKSRPFLSYHRKTEYRCYVRNGRDLTVLDEIFGFYVKFYIGIVLQDSIWRPLRQKLEPFACDLDCFYKIF